MHSNRATTL